MKTLLIPTFGPIVESVTPESWGPTPSFHQIKDWLRPWFPRSTFEHVSVLYRAEGDPKGIPADMFVDEIGHLTGLPFNERATKVYQTAWLRRHPTDTFETLCQQGAFIVGPAILTVGRIWF